MPPDPIPPTDPTPIRRAPATRRLLRMVRRRGVVETVRVPWRELRFRLRHPSMHRRITVTGGRGERADGHKDEATRIAIVEHALALVPPSAHAGAFVDVGCSRGRVLQVATRYPYQRLVGIELEPELAERARRNVRDARVEVIAADAGSWVVPDDVTVLYLFNPFGRDTASLLLAALDASQRRAPRTLVICDVSGVHQDLFEGAGFETTSQVPYISIWERAEVSPSGP